MPYIIVPADDGYYVKNAKTKEKMNKKPFKTSKEAMALKKKLDAGEGIAKSKVVPKKKEAPKGEKLPATLPPLPQNGSESPNLSDLIAQQGPPQGAQMPMGGGMSGMAPNMPGMPPGIMNR